MKTWGDLSWREKCRIKEGEVNSFDYLTGYTFQVKTKVQKGKQKAERKKDGQ